MVQLILSDISQKFDVPLSALSFCLLNGGVYRSDSRYRNVLLVFQSGKPFVIARWMNDETAMVCEQAAHQMLHQANFSCPVPKGHSQVGRHFVLYEEYCSGITAEELLRRRLAHPKEIIQSARALLEQLYTNTRSESSTKALHEEITEIFSTAQDSGAFCSEEFEEFEEYISNVLTESFSNQSPNLSMAHGDFLTRNILRSEQGDIAFDFEFTTRTHFAVCDWLRFFMYSKELLHWSMFHHGLVQRLVRTLDAPKPFAKYLSDNNTFDALVMLTYILDFNCKVAVCPHYLKPRLVAELHDKLRAGVPAVDVHPLLSTQISLQHTQTLAQEPTVESNQLTLLATEHHYGKAIEEKNRQIATLREELALKSQLLVQEVHVAHEAAASRDLVIESLIKSPAFRIGKLVTGTVKLIPGTKQLFERKIH